MPRAQPSLSSTIVSIAKEMQAQNDQNIMDAWKNGGQFEGKPVTDNTILAYWKDRMTHVSKDDPLYDTYSNTVTQLDYSIAESKISTLYSQGKVSAAKMAAFYTSWAKKIPVNSEFHRILERNAAQFARSLRGSGGGGGGRRRGGGGGGSAGAAARQQMKYEVPALYMTNVLTNVAQQMLLIKGNEDLTHFRLGDQENDPGGMIQIINHFNTDPSWAKYRAAVLKDLKTLDPAFKGNTFTLADYTRLLATQSASINQRAISALNHGKISSYTSLLKQRDKVDDLRRQSAAWAPTDQYFRNRDDWMRIWNSSTATPASKLAASGQYKAQLQGLEQQALKRGDMQQATALQSEISALDGQMTLPDGGNLKPTLHDDMTALHGDASENNATSQSDAYGTAQGIQALSQMQQAIQSGAAVVTYGTYSGGKFTPQAGGSAVGVMDSRYVSQDPSQFKVMPVAGTNGIESIYVQGAPIMATQQAPKPPSTSDQPPLPAALGGPAPQQMVQLAPTQVGTAFDIYQGNELVRIYGIPTTDGSMVYTLDQPWANGVQENFNQVKGQVLLNVPPGATTAYDPFMDPTNIQRTGVLPANTYLSPLVALGMSNPENHAQLASMVNVKDSQGLLDYAGSLAPNDPAQQSRVYQEIITASGLALQGTGPTSQGGVGPAQSLAQYQAQQQATAGEALRAYDIESRRGYMPPSDLRTYDIEALRGGVLPDQQPVQGMTTNDQTSPVQALADYLSPGNVGRKKKQATALKVPVFSLTDPTAGMYRGADVQNRVLPPPMSRPGPRLIVPKPPPPPPVHPPSYQAPDRTDASIGPPPLPPPPPFDYQPHPSGA